jgi:hypothetical protein
MAKSVIVVRALATGLCAVVVMRYGAPAPGAPSGVEAGVKCTAKVGTGTCPFKKGTAVCKKFAQAVNAETNLNCTKKAAGNQCKMSVSCVTVGYTPYMAGCTAKKS